MLVGSLKSCSLLATAVTRHQLVLPVSLHTSSVSESRIKRVQRHKPLWHIKKLNKAQDAPMTEDNKAFIQEVISDQYSGELLAVCRIYLAQGLVMTVAPQVP